MFTKLVDVLLLIVDVVGFGLILVLLARML